MASQIELEPSPDVPTEGFVEAERNGHVLHVDFGGRTVTVDDEVIPFVCKEFDLFAVMVTKPGRVWRRSELMESAWSFEKDHVSVTIAQTVTEHIYRVRKKLIGHWIETVPGAGYKFCASTHSIDLPEAKTAEVNESVSFEGFSAEVQLAAEQWINGGYCVRSLADEADAQGVHFADLLCAVRGTKLS